MTGCVVWRTIGRLPSNTECASFMFPKSATSGAEYRAALTAGRHKLLKLAKKMPPPNFARITKEGNVGFFDRDRLPKAATSLERTMAKYHSVAFVRPRGKVSKRDLLKLPDDLEGNLRALLNTPPPPHDIPGSRERLRRSRPRSRRRSSAGATRSQPRRACSAFESAPVRGRKAAKKR